MPTNAPSLLCKAVSQGENLSLSLNWQTHFAFKQESKSISSELFNPLDVLHFI